MQSNSQTFPEQHEPPEIKKLISVIDVQDAKQALLCLQFVYLQSLFRIPFLSDEYRLFKLKGN